MLALVVPIFEDPFAADVGIFARNWPTEAIVRCAMLSLRSGLKVTALDPTAHRAGLVFGRSLLLPRP
jgi:hypothetical protein